MTAPASTCCFSPPPTQGRSHALLWSVLSPLPSEHQLPPEPPNPPIPPDPPPSSRARPSSSLLHITSASSPPDPLLSLSLRCPLACSLLIVIHLHYRDQAKWYLEMCFHFVVMDLVRPVELPLTIYVLTLKTTCSTGQQISCGFSKSLWTRYGNIGVQSISLTTTSIPSSNVILSISMPPTPAAALSFTIQKALSLMSMVYNVVVESRVHIALYQRAILRIWTCFSTCSSNVSQLLLCAWIMSLAPVICLLCMRLTLEFFTLKVFSDNLTLIRAIFGDLQSKEVIGIVFDIRSISSGFASIGFFHLSRSKNTIVDILAKKALMFFASM